MIPGTYASDYDNVDDSLMFNDSRYQDDNQLLPDNLDQFSLQIDTVDF